MSRPVHASILMVAMVVLAAPLLANAAPGQIESQGVDRSAKVYAMADDVDCSKLDDEDARERCREAKRKNGDDKIDDVDCSKIDNEDARRRCLRAKIKN